MMPNVTRGDRMGGLMVYLAGPGRANEHTEPHLVAGSDGVMAWHGDDELNRDAALQLGRHLGQPQRLLDVEVSGGHVWHCSLSLRADEGELSDEKWSQIAEEFVDKMGFSETSGKAPCRWAAVRHGASTNGNDHIHIAVSLVREDGTKASVGWDWARAQTAARELEHEHGLEVLESREQGLGPKRARNTEQARSARLHERQTPTERLGRTVRACAVASVDEAEFVRRCRRSGLMVRPRFAAGRDDVVTGYSVAERVPKGEQPRWFGGQRLGRDLSLPQLRRDWGDTPQSASDAALEWKAAKRGGRVAGEGRETVEPDPKLWDQYAREVGVLRDRLRQVPIDDRATWAQVARETSGAFAAWSLRVEAEPGPLAAASDELAQYGQIRTNQLPAKRTPGPSVKGAAMLLLQATRGGKGPMAEAIMLRQLLNTMRGLYEAHNAIGDARAARRIEQTVRGELAQVAERLPAVPATKEPATPGAGSTKTRPPRGPVPNPLERQRREAATRAETGFER